MHIECQFESVFADSVTVELDFFRPRGEATTKSGLQGYEVSPKKQLHRPLESLFVLSYLHSPKQPNIMRQDTQAKMLLAVIKSFLNHGIATKASAQNTDSTFRLTAALLALTEQVFF